MATGAGGATTGGDRLTAATRSGSTGGQEIGATSTPGSLLITTRRLEASAGRSVGVVETGGCTEDVKRGGVSDGCRGVKPSAKALAVLLGGLT